MYQCHPVLIVDNLVREKTCEYQTDDENCQRCYQGKHPDNKLYNVKQCNNENQKRNELQKGHVTLPQLGLLEPMECQKTPEVDSGVLQNCEKDIHSYPLEPGHQ